MRHDFVIHCERCGATIECSIDGVALSASDVLIAKLDFAANAGWRPSKSNDLDVGICPDCAAKINDDDE